MDDLEKLRKLLPHWLEHNKEHAATYGEWADRASAAGRSDLAGVLDRLREAAVEMDLLFEEALKKTG